MDDNQVTLNKKLNIINQRHKNDLCFNCAYNLGFSDGASTHIIFDLLFTIGFNINLIYKLDDIFYDQLF